MSETPPSGKPNYGSAVRVAQIIHWLHQYPFGLSFNELKERLGVSGRTLARYIQTLKENFFDEDGNSLIESRKSESLGRLRFKRKGLDMEGSAYELMSLYIALDLMAFLDGTFLHESAQDLLDRLQGRLLRGHGHETSLVLKDFHKKFYHWSEAPKDYSAHNRILTLLTKALVLQRRAEILYCSPGNPEKKHCLEPLSLLMYKRALYLIARRYPESGKAGETKELTFAVERIQEVHVLSFSFPYPQDYEPAKRFENAFGLVRETVPERVCLRFQPIVVANVASRRWHSSQRTRSLDDGGLEMKFELEIGAEFLSWLLGYGPYVKVLEPLHLQERVIQQLRKASAQYEIDCQNA